MKVGAKYINKRKGNMYLIVTKIVFNRVYNETSRW